MTDILLIEDNIELAMLLQAFLKREGFSLCAVESGEAALLWLQKETPRLILLDITLPGMDGFALCRKLRKGGNIPIVILSARSLKADKLLGFELGADDYIEKPVDPDILTAKVKAFMKRTPFNPLHQEVLHSGSIRLDITNHKVFLREQEVEVTVKEFELLALFIRNPNRSLHKEYVFHQIWGAQSDSEYQTLTVHIKMLRSKIEDDPRNPQRITTVWGIGYRYEAH